MLVINTHSYLRVMTRISYSSWDLTIACTVPCSLRACAKCFMAPTKDIFRNIVFYVHVLDEYATEEKKMTADGPS